MNTDRARYGIIGFGEAGSAFARHISDQTGNPVLVADPLLNQVPPPPHIQQRLDNARVEIAPNIAYLAANCDVILSLVTVSIAKDVAAEAGAAWQRGLFIDFNSTSPVEKQQMATFFTGSNADSYIDGAILGSIAGEGTHAPLALAGPQAEQAHTWLSAIGLHPSVVSAQVGGASALKMCRSIFMKGVECLFVETLLAASHFNITESVLDTVQGTFEAYPFRALAKMLVTTHAVHCGRRAHEMDRVVEMLEAIDRPGQMSEASAAFLEASHRTGVADHFNGVVPTNLDDVIEYLNHYYAREGIT